MKSLSRILTFVCYSILCVGFLASLEPLAQRWGVVPFREGGIIENLQVLLLLLCVVIALVGATKAARYRGILLMVAIFAALGFIREFDSALDRFVPVVRWKLPGLVVILAGLALLYRSRVQIRKDLATFLHTPAFALLWCGLVFAWGTAQLIGHGAFLEGVMNSYERDLKRILEESLETFGYCVILVGVVEALLLARGERGEEPGGDPY